VADHREELAALDAEGHVAEDADLPLPGRVGEELGGVVDPEEVHGPQSE